MTRLFRKMADEPPPIDSSPSHAQEQDDAVSKEEDTIKDIPLDEDKPIVKEDPPAQGNIAVIEFCMKRPRPILVFCFLYNLVPYSLLTEEQLLE